MIEWLGPVATEAPVMLHGEDGTNLKQRQAHFIAGP